MTGTGPGTAAQLPVQVQGKGGPASTLIPRATVRLQFHAGFTLDDAVALVPYYDALGISHVYASPLLASQSGSTHGYDGVRPDQIDASLGGEPALRRLVQALRGHGMGLILDLVPNHMAASLENPWWFDLLEHGTASEYASFFDVDWDAGEGRVLLPWLDRSLDAVIAAGEVALRYDDALQRIVLHAGPARVPLAAGSYAQLLADAATGPADSGGAAAGDAALLQSLALVFNAAGAERPAHDAARQALATALQQCATLPATLQALLDRYRASDAAGEERLRALLGGQPWRLSDWKAAPRRINWRRFFDIGALVALRIEDEAVFDAVHAYPLALFAEGLVDGLRIDHVDGLRDPGGYCRRLRARMQRAGAHRPADLGHDGYLVVEKILAAGEPLRRDWPVHGTSGYDFMEQVGLLMHDPDGSHALTAQWQALDPACREDFPQLVLRARRETLARDFSADLQRTLQALAALLPVNAADPLLRSAVVALVEHFPVYRTYLGSADADAAGDPLDRAVLEQAAASSGLEAPASALLRRLIDALCATPGPAAAGATDENPVASAQRQDARAALQQLTPPIAAKAIEDTAFYRYGRLLSRNEVGADAGTLGGSIAAFHRQCQERAQQWPHALLATATHDHKRGEDARMRLAVLSRVPHLWAQWHAAWSAANAHLRTGLPQPVDAAASAPPAWAPDGIDEYMLYQALLGAWPADLRSTDAAAVAALGKRLAEWQRKALREGKRRSSWRQPDEAYEAACAGFLERILRSPAFLAAVERAVGTIAAAGALNGLGQVVLRLTVPGVPDLYQGTEFWDHSLVDPDNRRPLDHAARLRALQQPFHPAQWIAHWHDGRIKQQLIACLLQLRRARPQLFAAGSYMPLQVRGAHAGEVVAFLRSHAQQKLLVIVPVRATPVPAARGADLRTLVAGLRDASVELPGCCRARRWHDVLGGQAVGMHDDTLPLARVLHAFPLAVLACP